MKILAWSILALLLTLAACHPTPPDGLTVDTGLDGPKLPSLPEGSAVEPPENFYMLNLYNAKAELIDNGNSLPIYDCKCYRLKDQVYVQLFHGGHMDGISGFGARLSTDTVFFYEMRVEAGLPVKLPAKGSLVLNQHDYISANTLIGEIKATGEHAQLSGTFHCVVTEPRLK